MIDEEYERWWDTMISTVAYEVSRKDRFRGRITAPDLRNALWEWFLKASKPRKATPSNPEGLSRVDRYRRDHDFDEFEKIVARILREEATLYARRELAAQLGFSVEDEFFYTLPSLKNLVEQVFDVEMWSNPPVDHNGGKSTAPANEGGNWIATLADVSRAISRLPRDDQNLLEVAFKRGGLSRNDIADGLGISRRGVDHRIEAAVKRLWNLLGGPRWSRDDEDDEEWVGSRQVMTNEEARRMTEECA